MKYKYFLFALLLIFVILSLVLPNGVRAAVANNIWSVKAAKQYFDPKANSEMLVSPPITHHHPVIFLAQQALRMGKPDLALSLIYLQAKTGDPLALDLQAGLQYLQEDYGTAIQTWGDLDDSLSLEGVVYRFQIKGQTDLLVLGFQSLYDIDPEKYTSGLALALSSSGENDEAIALLELGIQQYPNSEYRGNWHRYMGDIYVNQQNYGKGERAFQQALQINPSDARTWRDYNLLCKRFEGDLESATACYERLLSFNPQDPEIYVAAGLIFERAQLNQQAFDAYLDALELDPSHQGALQGSQRILDLP